MNPIRQVVSNTRFLIYLVKTRQLGAIVGAVRHKIWSDTISFGLRRDLTVPFPAPDAAIPLTMRKATQLDIDRLANLDEPGICLDELAERRERREAFAAGMDGHSYVAVDEHDTPCYFQMLMCPEQNHLSRKLWNKAYPEVKPGQVLIEGAFVPTAFRGKRIMPRAMALLSEIARNDTTTEAITFVDTSNIASLKGCVRSGYSPYCHRVRRWRFFHETVTFEPIPENTSIPGVTEPIKETR
jgi:hypothetical protein